MGRSQQNLLTAVDVGSAKTCALVVEVTDGVLRYRGHGVSESRGSRKGTIVDLDKAVASVKRAVDEAEALAGDAVESAVVGIGGPHIRGVNTHGGIGLGGHREITRDDVRHAVDKARAIPLPTDRQPLHLLPQHYIVDSEAGVREPAGMTGGKLEVKVHVVTAAQTATQNVVTTLNRAGIVAEDTVYEGLACADSVLKPDERELGVCLVDIGAGSSEAIVFHEGAVAHTLVVPVGGDHFTNDIAVGLRTPLADAERIKRLFGCAVVTRVPETNEIEVPSVGDRPARLMPQRLLAEILEPRARELFEMLRDQLRHAGMLELCGTGIVVTGGGARLISLLEIAEAVMRMPARLGYPSPIGKLPALLAEPEYATLIGLALYGHRARLARGPAEASITSKLKALFARKGM